MERTASNNNRGVEDDLAGCTSAVPKNVDALDVATKDNSGSGASAGKTRDIKRNGVGNDPASRKSQSFDTEHHEDSNLEYFEKKWSDFLSDPEDKLYLGQTTAPLSSQAIQFLMNQYAELQVLREESPSTWRTTSRSTYKTLYKLILHNVSFDSENAVCDMLRFMVMVGSELKKFVFRTYRDKSQHVALLVRELHQVTSLESIAFDGGIDLRREVDAGLSLSRLLMSNAKLQEIKLQQFRWNDEMFAAFLRCLESNERLGLRKLEWGRRCDLTDNKLEGLAMALTTGPSCSTLESFELYYNELTENAFEGLAMILRRCISLKDLRIGSTMFGSTQPDSLLYHNFLETLATHSSLHRLTLNSCSITTDLAIPLLCAVKRCCHMLKELDIGWNPLNFQVLPYLSPLLSQENSSLEKLVMSSKDFFAGEIKLLQRTLSDFSAVVQRNTKLRTLEMAHGITDEVAAPLFQALTVNRTLKVLVLCKDTPNRTRGPFLLNSISKNLPYMKGLETLVANIDFAIPELYQAIRKNTSLLPASPRTTTTTNQSNINTHKRILWILHRNKLLRSAVPKILKGPISDLNWPLCVEALSGPACKNDMTAVYLLVKNTAVGRTHILSNGSRSFVNTTGIVSS